MEYFLNQLGGGCHAGAALKRKSCKQYPGEDADDCMMGPKGRCRNGTRLAHAFAVKLPPTAAQVAALEKARAAHTAKAVARRAAAAPSVVQTGSGCHLNPAAARKSCKQYAGDDVDGCGVGPAGRCRLMAGIKYGPRLPLDRFPRLVAAHAALAAKRAAAPARAAAVQQTGSGCHAGASLKRKSCKQYPGADADDCVLGPKGRCRNGTRLARAFAVKLPPTPAQLAALTKARAVRAAKAAAKKQTGGFWW